MNGRGWVCVGALVASLGVGACGTYDGMPTAPSPQPTSGDLTIEIAGIDGPNSFDPSPATASAGRMVMWHNSHDTAHHIVFDAADVDAGLLGPGMTSQPVSLPAGTWRYHCTIHGEMTGVLTVMPTGATLPPSISAPRPEPPPIEAPDGPDY